MSPTAGKRPGPPDSASGERDLARIGALVSDQGRCRMLLALGDGRALPAGVLAAEAGLPRRLPAATCTSSPPAACKLPGAAEVTRNLGSMIRHR